MNNVINAFPGGVVSPVQVAAFNALEAALLDAITAAKDVGVPQGFIVALLHGHALQQTQTMIDRA